MSNENWKKNLQTVFDLKVPHISCYALTVEEKTVLASQIKKQKIAAPEDEKMVQQFSILLEEMNKHHYTHYEISNFCKEPHFAQHFLFGYWAFRSFLRWSKTLLEHSKQCAVCKTTIPKYAGK